MGEKTRAWLASSILAGQASDVRLRLRGNLRDFPFRDPASGQFLVTARVAGGVLEYGEAWPRIEDIDADLRFEADRMEIAGRGGRIFGAKLSGVRVAIPNPDDTLRPGASFTLTTSGSSDLDGDPLNGCEYGCMPTGPETRFAYP